MPASGDADPADSQPGSSTSFERSDVSDMHEDPDPDPDSAEASVAGVTAGDGTVTEPDGVAAVGSGRQEPDGAMTPPEPDAVATVEPSDPHTGDGTVGEFGSALHRSTPGYAAAVAGPDDPEVGVVTVPAASQSALQGPGDPEVGVVTAPTESQSSPPEPGGLQPGAVTTLTESRPAPPEPVEPAQPVEPAHIGWAARAVIAAPDRAVGGFLAVCLVVAVSLQLHQFHWFYVLPVAVIVVVLTGRFMPSYRPVRDGEFSTRAAVWGSVLTLAMAVAWLVANLPHADQMLYAYRDPQMYMMRGLYLVDHASPVVSVRPETVEMARQFKDIHTGIYGGSPRLVSPTWGASLLPGLMGLMGWFGGQGVALHANIVIGAICLVALYAAGRRLLGPLWALLPVVALGVAMPLAAFSRETFSEPTALVLFCGVAICLWVALQRRSIAQAALAGVFAGAVTFARIDGPLVVIGGLACLGGCGLLAIGRPVRHRIRRMVVAFAVAALALTALGFTDLYLNSLTYFNNHRSEWIPLVSGTGVLAVIAWAITFRWRWLRRIALLIARRRVGVAVISGLIVLAAAAVLLTRPLWWTARNITGSSYMAAAKSLQTTLGLPIDPHRSYDEYQIFWQGWYYGWALLGLGIVGSVLIVMMAVLRRDPKLVVWMALPGAVGALYLTVRASGLLAVDQIWVERRFLPEVIPGMLVLAALVARQLVRWILGRRRRRSRPARWMPVRRTAAGVVSLAAVAAFLFPVSTWGPLFTVTHGGGLAPLARAMCAAAPSTRAIYAGDGDSRHIAVYLGTLQEMCGLDAVWVVDPTAERLSKIAAAWKGSGEIAVYTLNSGAVTWTGSTTDPLSEVDYTTWNLTIMSPPDGVKNSTARMYAGILQPNGELERSGPVG
jgi:hypothetical protein